MWNDLTPEQLLRVMPAVYGLYRNETARRLDLLPVLLGISRLFLLQLTNVQLVQLKGLADFLLTGPVTLTTQLLPSLRGRWYQRRLWGPADELANVSFLEFAFADAYFVAYATGQEEQWLDHLVATLYRSQRRPYRPLAADYGGDRREPFNEHVLEARLPRVARLPRPVKLAVFTWYRGCRHALEQRYPHVFTPAHEEQARQGHTDGWAHVLRELSGQAFGSYAETGRQALQVVLAKMNDDLARAEELRREEALRSTT